MFDGTETAPQLVYVGVEAWPDVEALVRPHLQKMADKSHGRFLACDLAAFIARGDMQAWLIFDRGEIACAFFTEIINYPRLRAIRAVGISGHRMRRWIHLLPLIEESARANFGCTLAEALYPRKLGLLFERWSSGWREYHVMSEKELA